jgi:epoxyqueuosine reductase
VSDDIRTPSRAEITRDIRGAALELGFARVGFAPAERFGEAALALERWRAAGLNAEMSYLDTNADRADPRALLPEARSMVVVALGHGPLVPLRTPGGLRTGRVAAYARGRDYHTVMKDKLYALARRCTELAGRPVAARVCVDTAPLLEREAARRAGVGFLGKSAMCIVPGLGSTVLLGVLLVDVELEPDRPVDPGCGRCTACLDRCPTGAFVAPHVVDARRCVAYLTIEHTGPIPRDLRPAIGDRIFGCDECQDVCPFNAVPGRGASEDLASQRELEAVDLVALLELGAAGYRKLVRGTAMRRTHRAQLARNAAIALGNSGDPAAVPPLVRALERDRYPLVRGHAAWALGRLGGDAAEAALRHAERADPDAAVREEAAAALSALMAPKGT